MQREACNISRGYLMMLLISLYNYFQIYSRCQIFIYQGFRQAGSGGDLSNIPSGNPVYSMSYRQLFTEIFIVWLRQKIYNFVPLFLTLAQHCQTNMIYWKPDFFQH